MLKDVYMQFIENIQNQQTLLRTVRTNRCLYFLPVNQNIDPRENPAILDSASFSIIYLYLLYRCRKYYTNTGINPSSISIDFDWSYHPQRECKFGCPYFDRFLY